MIKEKSMDKKRIRSLSESFYSELVNNTIPFWIEHATDREHGGFTTCLDRRGDLLSPDKPMWVLSRISWLFARLYNDLEPRKEWLDLARHGIEFIRKYGFDRDGRMFYAVTREGQPLRKRRYLFTETFGVIALAEYARASGDADCLALAKKTMHLVLDLYDKPGALEPKVFPDALKTRGHSMAMIRINTLQVLRSAERNTEYDRWIDKAIEEVFRYFVKPEKKALLETVGENGEYLGHLPEGRCVNPGHAIETAWFIMEEGRHRNDMELVKRALPILDWSLEMGWDKKHGGILYFLDIEGRQPFQLEWDMKLWWPHNEAIYATLLAYALTGEQKYERWFEKILDWSLKHFPDKKHGEWIGYLHRDGTVALDLKGSYFKGPFHLPRQQLFCHLLLKEMLAKA
jgi:N-acylglucosamine 2-epimerase